MLDLAAVLAVLRRPRLWSTAASTALGLAPRGWWRRPPFLPLPDADWVRFRTVTAYGGDGDAPIRPDELVTWLEWRRSQRRAA